MYINHHSVCLVNMRVVAFYLLTLHVAVSLRSTLPHHTPVLLKELEMVRYTRQIKPIETAALSLYKHKEDLNREVGVVLAHELLQVYDLLAKGRIDHSWKHVAAHKLCDALVKAEPHMWETPASSPVQCLLQGSQALLRMCHNKVQPWGVRNSYCEVALADPACDDKNPFSGLCVHAHHRHRKRYKPKHIKRFVDEHNLTHTHHSWASKHHATKAVLYKQSMHRRIKHAESQKAPKPPPKRRTHGPHLPSVTIAMLISTYRPELHARIVAKDGAKGHKLCTSLRQPVVGEVLTRLYPQATHVSVHTVYTGVQHLLEDHTCDAVVTWHVAAEMVHLHPCTHELKQEAISDAGVCGNRGQNNFIGLIQHPEVNTIGLQLPDAQLAVRAREEEAESRRWACESMHKWSMHGQYPGEASKVLSKACGVQAKQH